MSSNSASDLARVRHGGRVAGDGRWLRAIGGVVGDLDRLIDPVTRGDPESPLRWTSKSLGKLREALVGMGHEISESTLGKLLKGQGFRLQANQKTREGSQHPDRDAQFAHINQTVARALADGQPTVSIDCKKKELVGDYKAVGGSGSRPGSRSRSRATTFPPGSRRRSPTGSTTSPTTRGTCRSVSPRKPRNSALASIRAWWEHLGKQRFPNATPVDDQSRLRRLGTAPEICEGRATALRRRHRPRARASAITHRGRRNGTKSSTGCSASAASTGAGDR